MGHFWIDKGLTAANVACYLAWGGKINLYAARMVFISGFIAVVAIHF